jgi:hypothetical protein
MANERTYPCLPCGGMDESIAFYESLGFKKTYRQVRPNPYAVVALEDIQLHLFGIEGFNPAESYSSVIVAVPDPDSLYHDFAAGLRKMYGKLPVAGIPRILRPRKKYGTVRDSVSLTRAGTGCGSISLVNLNRKTQQRKRKDWRR